MAWTLPSFHLDFRRRQIHAINEYGFEDDSVDGAGDERSADFANSAGQRHEVDEASIGAGRFRTRWTAGATHTARGID
jgi:hypothetical protein